MITFPSLSYYEFNLTWIYIYVTSVIPLLEIKKLLTQKCTFALLETKHWRIQMSLQYSRIAATKLSHFQN